MKTTKQSKVLKRLLAGYTVTQAQAVNWWGHYRLAVTICSLRSLGYPIITESLSKKDGGVYGRYRLEGV